MDTRVLVYPNITYAKNLEADSYVVLLGAILRQFESRRPDLRFTLLLPDAVESLRLSNVEQIEYPLPTYPNTMRAHFDTRRFLWAIDWKNRSYDVVWSHLPEHTLQIRNVFDNATNEQPPIVGYCHWYELPENTVYPVPYGGGRPMSTLLHANLAGTLAMDVCGVNSEWLRRLALSRAEALLSPTLVERLAEIIRPQYLGATLTEVPAVEVEPGLVVFNHRANDYTGFRDAVVAFDELYARRQDFRVAFTLADDVDRPWATRIHARGRDDYLGQLARAWVGVGCFKSYSAWSLSTMDGLAAGVPYVLPDGLCYPEMVGDDYPLLYSSSSEFLPTLERVLDSPTLRHNLSARARAIAERFSWEERIVEFERTLDEAAASQVPIGRSKRYEDVLALARRGATKSEILKQMGWGKGIPFTPYRARLRADGISV